MTAPFAFAALALSAAALAPRAAPQPTSGLWVGPIQLCRSTVARTAIHRTPDGSQSLYVLLRPALRPVLERETAARVGRTMTIRLGSRTLLEPIVNEPITGGQVEIVGSQADLPAFRRAARGRCHEAAR